MLVRSSQGFKRRIYQTEILADANQNRQIRDLQLGTSQPFGLSILGLVQGLSSLSIAFYTNWRLTLVVLSVVPVIALGVGILSQQAQSHVEKHEQKLTQATKMANNSISNIVTVKCFNAQDHEWRLYHTAVREAAASCLKQGIFSAAQVGFVRFAGTTMFVQGKCAYETGFYTFLRS